MAQKEKGRPAGGDPIPKIVHEDNSEFTPRLLLLQVSRLTHRSAISVGEVRA
jgi:hypothetical protein